MGFAGIVFSYFNRSIIYLESQKNAIFTKRVNRSVFDTIR